MRSSMPTRIAAAAFLGVLLVMGVLVLSTGLRVEAFGPAIIFGAAAVGVGLLLLSPAGKDR